ncbi:maltose alpha-D-glucosyltransferase, partial [Metapseudomonas otitidis]
MHDPEYLDWLSQRSMLESARQRARLYAGQPRLWQQPYALTRPRSVTAVASVWFTAYPASIIAPDGMSVLQALADERLWSALSELGVQGIHT